MSKIQHQHGVVLVVSLIFLMLMTIIGVTAMQGTTQEEKMARNAAQRALAFQYAEAGLRAAEASLTKIVGSSFDNTTLGLRGPVDITTTNIANYWMDKYDWKAPAPIDDGGSICWCDDPSNAAFCDTLTPDIRNEQRYVIEELTTVTGDGEPPLDASKPLPTANKTLFRITARSTGNITDAVVILQSTIM